MPLITLNRFTLFPFLRYEVLMRAVHVADFLTDGAIILSRCKACSYLVY